MYTPLNIKTQYSLLHSMVKIADLINIAKKYNYQTLAITDNNLCGVMEFYNASIKNNIKPIIGLEIMIADKSILLYAKNYQGYKNLMKLSTLESENQLNRSKLDNFTNDLICILPFSSRDLFDDLNKIYEHTFLGYSNDDERMLLKGENLVYMNPVFYLNKQDKEYYPYLEAISRGVKLSEVNVDTNNHHLLTSEEINSLRDLENNRLIEQMCDFKLEVHKDLLPIYKCPNGISSYDYLKNLCKEGLKKIFGERVNKIYIDRLKYELDIINRMGFCNYFLIVWDYVKYAKDHNILVGPGRGSAAGSLVSYCLNITTIDPIRYNLLFERFLNPERISMPDIDIDFEYNRREEVINYCIDKYGKKNVAGIITFGTLASRQVIRDVARSLDIDLKIVDRLSKMLDSKKSLKDNYNSNIKLQDFIKNDDVIKKLYKVSTKFEGLKRHASIHAAGIVMSDVQLDDTIPLVKNSDNFYTTAYTMEYLEENGLLKMDFLALRNLTLIADTLEDVNKNKIALTFDNIPMDDRKAINIFTTVNTVGIFQFESAGMMNFLRKLKPNSFEEISAAIALFRPGPMDNIDIFIKRRNKGEKVDYIHPDLKQLLEPTYGIMIYQEQIMQVASIMAGYSLGEADVLRKAISKKKEEVLQHEKIKFTQRSLKLGYSSEIVEKVYALILKFASYGFNRAHSVAYSVIAYKMAYLKAHYPAYFMKNLLTMVIGSEIKTKEYIYETKLNKINILQPDINKSSYNYNEENGSIRFPLSCIKGVGFNTINSILEERKKGSFRDIYDFIRRCYQKGVNSKTLESLISAGVFDSFGFNRKTIINNLDNILNYGELIKDLSEEFVDKPEIIITDEYTRKELMAHELETFGFYLSNHPITEYKLKNKNLINVGDIKNYFDKNIKTIVYIDRIKEIDTKKGDKMAFLTGSDEINTVDIVMFPIIYSKHYDLKSGDIIEINARVEKRFDKLQLVVNELIVLED